MSLGTFEGNSDGQLQHVIKQMLLNFVFIPVLSAGYLYCLLQAFLILFHLFKFLDNSAQLAANDPSAEYKKVKSASSLHTRFSGGEGECSLTKKEERDGLLLGGEDGKELSRKLGNDDGILLEIKLGRELSRKLGNEDCGELG
mmetsp:Transcript_36625/g.72023  ORF Transcript_36625/g.72023 Transcript_36625/m.72023 type:complete len:143 (+) Transcript_36625:487-915(+)